MKKYKTTYEILDDFGDVVRIVIDKPTSDYQYRTIKVLIFDTNSFEDALF
jgi:hypothetical protein